MKKQVGIWLDFKEATIIKMEGDEPGIATLNSEIEDFRPKGGARSKSPWGPMDKISESKYLERRKQQEKSYFQKLMTATKDVDELFIFGPAEAKEGLLKAIKARTNFKPIVKGFEAADSMTLNQKIARVKTFFQS